jgi:alkylation response protein AidB-like acyl-CoA dehydrogenase
LASIYCNSKARTWTNQRAAAAARRDGVPGPMGSVGKLAYSNGLTRLAEAAALIVGSATVTDTGEWGTFAWSELILGAPGMRIAGGSDEIQRNTIAERVLGLPKEPR